MNKQVELERIKKMSQEIVMIADKLLSGYQTPIAELGLSNRALNSLARGSIEYVEQLVKIDFERLLKMRNIGIVTANEIKGKVKLLGFDCWQ